MDLASSHNFEVPPERAAQSAAQPILQRADEVGCNHAMFDGSARHGDTLHAVELVAQFPAAFPCQELIEHD